MEEKYGIQLYSVCILFSAALSDFVLRSPILNKNFLREKNFIEKWDFAYFQSCFLRLGGAEIYSADAVFDAARLYGRPADGALRHDEAQEDIFSVLFGVRKFIGAHIL